MSRHRDAHRIGFLGDCTDADCHGPSKLKKAFLADAQALRKVAGTAAPGIRAHGDPQETRKDPIFSEASPLDKVRYHARL